MAVYNGTEGDDYLIGVASNDTLNGFGGNDNLNGGLGRDTLNGGDGDDILNGYRDRDEMYGGDGSDTFVFNHYSHSEDQGGKRDLIGDFDATDFIQFVGAGVFSLDQIVITETNQGWRITVDVGGEFIDQVFGIDIIGVQPTLSQFII